MSTPSLGRLDAGTDPSGVRGFLSGAAGRATLVGFAGAALITFGGFGSGAVRRRDPLLEEMHLSWLRFGHGLVLSTAMVWIGVLLMIAAWVRLGRESLAHRTTVARLRWVVPVWIAPLLLAVPMFSRDAYSYLAQGALLRDGFDPYAVGPVANPGILLDNVSNVWTTTTAPYGPLFLLLGEGITSLTGDNVIAGTMLLRLTMLPGLALTMWAVPRIARHFGADPAVALWLAVLNPLVLVHLIGGVHNEMLMVGLMTAGIAAVLDHRHVLGMGLVAVAVAIKATAGIALPFMVWMWMQHERTRLRAENDARRERGEPTRQVRTLQLFVKAAGIGFVVFAAVFVVSSAVAGVGIGWLTALSGSAKIINWLSLPTILAHFVTVGTGWFTGARLGPVLEVTRLLCAIALVVVLVTAWWRSRHSERSSLLGILVSLVAIVILSPAALPWYYSWPLAVAAGLTMSITTLTVLVGLSAWLMLVFQPDGSIGLYTFPHVVLAIVAAVVAALSLRQVDPLRLRSVTHPDPEPPFVGADAVEPAHLPADTSEAAVAAANPEHTVAAANPETTAAESPEPSVDRSTREVST
ncbi:alpha-(1-_6)-mannopyranosyltransferase A [Rhodococcoides corynebacterioides]|uniref:Alpha-(1->6)-mannopyranosyltransferase A n=1 Tax=Rhodococcoides corynebacterioides TaxID=53972 RepID=A0ABS7P2T1_9NOCA|nr:alpha-(1->6)-mannopyranosyltransferase A [Rhodococcus corynebacterioides]MBY6366692.1 alpha-(1->6)-mannopyranosyltransferase A [Rhodococcus corynebacterioides]MBY6408741.1 alpha-(1->6)-mannopyranosyltransferase A [Rhodococcus corynebacterioides]